MDGRSMVPAAYCSGATGSAATGSAAKKSWPIGPITRTEREAASKVGAPSFQIPTNEGDPANAGMEMQPQENEVNK